MFTDINLYNYVTGDFHVNAPVLHLVEDPNNPVYNVSNSCYDKFLKSFNQESSEVFSLQEPN